MFNNLSDDKILEYLMNSDYNEDFKPSELKFLLLKFKYYYRLLHGRFTNLKADTDLIINNLNKDLESSSKKINQIQIENGQLRNEIELSKKVFKLTLKERITGVVDISKKRG